MRYTVDIKRSAERELDRLPHPIRQRITVRIQELEANPRPSGSRKLRGGEGYRLRAGDYRVLYTIDDGVQRVVVYGVAHRRDVYR